MPHTVNGIGTHYYGKSEHEVVVGDCQSCGYHGPVSAYNTRLWFVVFFIPIIPLGRKRILNDCPKCRRHFVASLAKWEAQRQATISGAAEEFRNRPTPEAAITLHNELLGFQQMAQARELRGLVAAKFPADAKLHEAFGGALAGLGFVDEADEYFTRAHALQPDLPVARGGVARRAIREGRIEDARALLDFMEQPGAGQLHNLGPLEALADAYRAGARPEEALKLYLTLLRELPVLGGNAMFRGKVAAAEKALAQKTGAKVPSVLPKKKFSWRDLFGGRSPHEPVSRKKALAWTGIVILLIAAVMLGGNEWVRRHRTVFVVNGLAAPVTVEIAGVGSTTVRPGGREMFTVQEGDYHARITGAVREEVDVPVHALDYAARWADHPVWVVNPGGAAILERTVAIYSRKGEPGSADYTTGETVSRFNNIDRQFEPLPPSLSMKSSERSRTLTGLEIFDGPAEALYRHYLNGGKEAEAKRFAMQHLRARPDDDGLLNAYLRHLPGGEAVADLEKLLASRLDYRPVAIQWHRTYQSIVENPAREQRLLAEYDAMLKKEPDNAALVYLRGRISPDREEALRSYTRASQLDPKNPFPIYALGYGAFSSGDLEGARPLLEKAARMSPADQTFSSTWRSVRMALGETAEVEKDLRAQLSRQPFAGELLAGLVMHLAGAGRREDAEKEIAAFEIRAGRGKPGVAEMKKTLENLALYAAGDLPALEKALAGDSRPGSAFFRYQVLVEMGRLDEAVRPPGADSPADAPGELALFVASSLAGKAGDADAARLRAIAILEKKGADLRRAADLLRGTTPPVKEQLDAVVVSPTEKALLCVALAQRFPAQREELRALARKLNVEPAFPFHLIRRAIGPQ